EPRKQAEQLVQLGELAVRYRYPVADAGRAELLALQQSLEDRALVLPGQFSGFGGQLLQRLFFAVDLERRNDRVGLDEIGERHGFGPGESSAGRQGSRKAADHRERPRGRQWAALPSVAGGSIQPIWPSLRR